MHEIIYVRLQLHDLVSTRKKQKQNVRKVNSYLMKITGQGEYTSIHLSECLAMSRSRCFTIVFFAPREEVELHNHVTPLLWLVWLEVFLTCCTSSICYNTL